MARKPVARSDWPAGHDKRLFFTARSHDQSKPTTGLRAHVLMYIYIFLHISDKHAPWNIAGAERHGMGVVTERFH